MKKLKLVKIGNSCDSIQVRSKYASYPIGKVCHREGGWYHTSATSRGEAYNGPVKTKTLAIRKAVKSYISWIGHNSYSKIGH